MPSEGRLVRSASGLFAAGGLLVLLTTWLPGAGVASGNSLDVAGLLSLVAGALAWVLPWERWSGRASLTLVPVALGLVCLADVAAGGSPFTYNAYYVMVFAWVGLCHPPRTGVWLAPFAVPFYLLPPLLRHGPLAPAGLSMLLTLSVGLVVGETVAWAMTRARTAQRLAEHRSALLHEVLRATTGLHQLEPERLLTGLVESTRSLGFAWAGMAVFSTSRSSWKLLEQSSDAPGPRAAQDRAFSAESGPPGLVVSRGRPLLLQGPDAVEALAAPPFGALELRSLAAAPVVVDGVPVAVLLGGIRHGDLGAEELEALTLLSIHAGRGLDNAARFRQERRARRRLAHISVRDELTGVGNRRHASALLESLVPGDALVMIDLDHFKQVNDDRGHQAGDALLQGLAAHLRQGVRDADLVARYGGEEFLLVLRGVGAEGGLRSAERLCSSWHRSGAAATFSAGVSVHAAGDSPELTLARADSALYQAKRSGRNRVRMDPTGLQDQLLPAT